MQQTKPKTTKKRLIFGLEKPYLRANSAWRETGDTSTVTLTPTTVVDNILIEDSFLYRVVDMRELKDLLGIICILLGLAFIIFGVLASIVASSILGLVVSVVLGLFVIWRGMRLRRGHRYYMS
jgi:hypothetical protein